MISSIFNWHFGHLSLSWPFGIRVVFMVLQTCLIIWVRRSSMSLKMYLVTHFGYSFLQCLQNYSVANSTSNCLSFLKPNEVKFTFFDEKLQTFQVFLKKTVCTSCKLFTHSWQHCKSNSQVPQWSKISNSLWQCSNSRYFLCFQAWLHKPFW